MKNVAEKCRIVDLVRITKSLSKKPREFFFWEERRRVGQMAKNSCPTLERRKQYSPISAYAEVKCWQGRALRILSGTDQDRSKA